MVGFQNRGDSVYNLTHIGASLHSPFDFNYHIQNFTYREVNAEVGPGEEGSIEYSFTPDKSLEADLEFQLSISLYYNDTTENKFWRSTIFNSTIELSEAKADFSIKTYVTPYHTIPYLYLISTTCDDDTLNTSTPYKSTGGCQFQNIM